MIKFLCEVYFRMAGWKLVGEMPPNIDKCVMVAAPHTSNWDYPLTMGAFSLMKVPLHFLGKKELFFFPLGIIMRSTGGIAVDRSKRNNLVEYMTSLFEEYDRLALVIPPEGTRSKVAEWKTGFYRVALAAKVPIALGYLDYDKKHAGVLGLFYPTGDLEKDLPAIKAYYKDVAPKHKDKW